MSAVASRSLRELQRWFAGELGVGDASGPRPPRIASRPGKPAFPKHQRLRVYADAYVARLVEVLAGDYGALRDLLGAKAFDRIARAYLRAHPSRHPNLNRLGARLPAFLQRRGGVGRGAVALARLELALTRAFDAVEFAPLAAEAMAALSPRRWEHARLVLNPSVQVLRLPAAAADRFTSWRQGTPVPSRSGVRQGDIDLCVVRIGDQVIRRELPRSAARLLARLRRGLSLAKALRGLPAGLPVDAWFAQWRADGMFTAVR